MIEGTEELVKTATMQYMSGGTFRNRSNFADKIQHHPALTRADGTQARMAERARAACFLL